MLQLLEHGAVAIQQVHGVLGEIAHLDAGADGNASLVRFGSTSDQLQQCRFPRH